MSDVDRESAPRHLSNPAGWCSSVLFMVAVLWADAILASADDVESIKRQVAELQEQLDLLREQLATLESAGESEALNDPGTAADATPDPQQAGASAESSGTTPETAVTTLAAEVASLDDRLDELAPAIELGGALRLNYAWRDYDDSNKDRVGDFELELFRVNARGTVGDVILDAEWRRYNDFQAIHHGWVGYDFSDQLQGQLGITQVPFGILPYASHGFWFGGTYYLGLEDDYDTGIKFVHTPSDDWTFHYAFFKNPEYASDSRAGRYSFDLVTGGDQQNAEVNQLNLRAERHLSFGSNRTLDLGLSYEVGGIYNDITRETGDRFAVAAHADANLGPWNLQFQGIRYEFEPENPDGVSDAFVQTGAFGFPFLMAAKADVLSVNVARDLPVQFGPITGMTCYNDFTYIHPDVRNSADSIQNVTGCSVAAGGIFAYFDWIAGKNMWFAGGDGIGRNADTAGKWRSRLNVNIGFYF